MKEETECVVDTTTEITQEVVIVVSLVQMLTESFGCASDLYKTLKRKSDTKNCDDDKTKFPDRHPYHGRRHSHIGFDYSHRRRHVGWKDSKDDHRSENDEELILSASVQIRAEYQRGYRKWGEAFARGDVTTHTQLQAQIIQLQHVCLSIHQDLLLSAYLSPSSSHSHLLRLIQTTRTTHTASIRALSLQHDRLIPAKPFNPPSGPEPGPVMPGAFPDHSPRCDSHHSIKPCPSRRRKRRSSWSSSSSSSSSFFDSTSSSSAYDMPLPLPEPIVIAPEPKPRPQPKPIMKPTPKPFPRPKPKPQPPANRLFCPYATKLQRDPKLSLIDNFMACGNYMCQCCRSRIATRPGKAWEIIMDNGKKFDGQINMLTRTFLVKNRFVIKSHRENGGFACLLCARYRPSDVACREIGALMEHLWRDHTSEELAMDEDIVES